MIQRTLAVLLIVAAAAAVSAKVVAAQNPVVPEMYTGHTNRPPKTFAVSPTANQITANHVIGADIKNADGDTIAKISDIIIDRNNSTAAVAIIAPAGSKPFDHGRQSAVAWSSLKFEPKPIPHFATRLNQTTLDGGAALVAKAKNSRSYYDVKADLLGKDVVAPDGAQLGHVQDLVVTFGTGHLVALVINTGGFISLGGVNNHAVAWNAAEPQASDNGGPVRVALSKAQVDGAPVTASIAAAPIASQPGNQNIEIRRDSTGNISGTRIPAPQDQR
jgi:sporulation protein YlmC with PRC-barrel domain